MNVAGLKRELERIGIDPRWYSFDSSSNDGERFCLVLAGAKWEVYYSERGSRSDVNVFDQESDACRHFLARILSDHVVRQPQHRSTQRS